MAVTHLELVLYHVFKDNLLINQIEYVTKCVHKDLETILPENVSKYAHNYKKHLPILKLNFAYQFVRQDILRITKQDHVFKPLIVVMIWLAIL